MSNEKCCRCLKPTPATSTTQLTWEKVTYTLALCDQHAAALQRDIHAWLRTAREVGRDRSDDSRLNAAVRAAAERAQPKPTAGPDDPRVRFWRFSSEAAEQFKKNQLSLKDVYDATNSPHRVMPHLTRAELEHRIRGPVEVVVDKEMHLILTIYTTGR